MMKSVSLPILLLFLSTNIFGQAQRNELANSKIFVSGTNENGKNHYKSIEIKTILKDTIIQNVKFSKFQTETFKDYAKERIKAIYFESYKGNTYTLLDSQLNVVHALNYASSGNQRATIFGITDSVGLEYIDTRDQMPRDRLIPDNKIPRKFYLLSKRDHYVVIIPDLKTAAVVGKGANYTKQLFGDNINSISNSLTNNYNISNAIKVQKEDEIQLFYRRKWYNDTTNLAEYEDKQFKNIKYIGDTAIGNNKALKFTIEGYNYLSGDNEESTEFYLNLTDSGYYNNELFIPFKIYKNELRIVGDGKENYLFLQGVDYDSIGKNIYPRIIQYFSNSPYRNYILAFFPMPYVEFGNVQGVITYSKIMGKENGSKRERTYITTKTNIRKIKCISDREISISLFLLRDCKLSISIGEDAGNKEVFNKLMKGGEQNLILATPQLIKGNYYQIQVNYAEDNNSGSISNGFTANY